MDQRIGLLPTVLVATLLSNSSNKGLMKAVLPDGKLQVTNTLFISCLTAQCRYPQTLSEGLTIVLSVQACCAQASGQEEQRQEWLMMRRLRPWQGSGAACNAASPLTGASGLTLTHPSSTIGSLTRAKTAPEGNQVARHHAL